MYVIEDDVTIGHGMGISCHTVENMVLKLAPIYYRKGCTMRSMSHLMPGCTIEPYSILLEASQVLKGETVPIGQIWAGLPAEPIMETTSNHYVDSLTNIPKIPKSDLADKKDN